MAVYTQSILTPIPNYLQSGSYDAKADRKPWSDILAPGVVGVNDYVVTWTTGMSFTVAGGVAWILGQNVSDQGSFRQYNSITTTTLSVGAAHATLPRIDTIILRAMDNPNDASGFQEGRIEIVPGTATAGADLTNLNGKANLTTLGEASKSVLLLAYVLVPANAVTLDATKFADKRVRAAYALNGGAADGQLMVWSAALGKWVPGAMPVSAMTLIDDYTVVGSALAVYDTNARLGGNIPSTYKHLQLIVSGRGDIAGNNVPLSVQFNGDTAGNYDNESVEAFGATTAAVEGVGATGIILGEFPGSTSPAGAAGQTEAMFANYAATTFNKTATIQNASKRTAATGGIFNWLTSGHWRSTAAITRLVVYMSSGNFVIGTRFSLYGIN